MAFVKLDTGLVDSSLWVERDQRSLFVTALLMAKPYEIEQEAPQLQVRSLEPTGWVVPPGWYGLVRAAGVGIVRMDGMDREEGLNALEALGAPDPESRSQDYEGRRLVRIDGGYLVLNFMKYRDKDHTAALRQRRLRERRKAVEEAAKDEVTPLRHVTSHRQIAEADGREQSAETDLKTTTAREALLSLVPNRMAWDAELRAMEQQMGGHHPASAEEIERAAMEYVCNNDPKERRFNIRSFVHYVKVVQAPAFTPRGGKDAARDFNAALEAWAKESDDA